MSNKVAKSDEQWRRELTPEQYAVCRRKGTEAPFTGMYNTEKRQGVYHCACCGNPLFDSKTKFDSGTGWPSFWAPLNESQVETKTDKPRNAASRSHVQSLRRASRTYFRGWPRAHPSALLHQFCGAGTGCTRK